MKRASPPRKTVAEDGTPLPTLLEKKALARDQVRAAKAAQVAEAQKVSAHVAAPVTEKVATNAGRNKKKNASQEDLLKLMPFLPAETIAQLLQSTPDWQQGIAGYQEQTESKGFPTDPVEFMRDTLGYAMWDKLAEICHSVEKNHNTVVESSFGTGKSVSASALACWFLTVHSPSIVITVAPCYDDQTEILTDSGWKLFKDLSITDKVAQLNNDNLEYVQPTGIVEFPYEGEMIGFKSQLVDFLVTPNHRCLFDRTIWRKEFRNDVYAASEIYGKNGRFRKIAGWQGEDTGIDENWAEFLGFWFAEGYAQVEPVRRHYRVTVTGRNTQYIEDLLERVGLEKRAKKQEKHQNPGCYDYTINSLEMATEFVVYGNSHTKRVPDIISNAETPIIKAFLRGFEMGDGGTDKNGSTRLYSCNRELAGDLQVLALKCGIIANVNHTVLDTAVNGHVYKNQDMYQVGFWKKRGEFPVAINRIKHQNRTNLCPGWYKQPYSGYVYCVSVPSGIVLVRRNGKYIWSGNTFNQVANIIWRYMRTAARKANLPGQVFETPRWEIASDHYAIGLSPKKDTGRDGDTISTLQGFHGPRMLVIMDEAAGLPKAIWDSVNGLAVGDQCRILAIGNPVEQAGPFYDATLNPSWHHIRISAFDHPNVKEGHEVIPGAVTRSWVEERAKEWATEVAPGTPNAVHLPWIDKYYEPMPIFQAKVLGIPPEQAEDQLIKLSWVLAAQERVLNERGSEVVIGLDPAPRNGDDNSLCVRQGMQVTHLTRLRGQDTQQITEWLALQTREFHASKVYIDDVGSGAGATDRARVMGLPVVAVNFARSAVQKKRFANLRAECWWKVRELLREGKLAIPNDPRLQADLIMPKFAPDMYGRILLESKDDIRARLGRSPDTADSLAMTFALPTGALEDESMYELKRLGQTEAEGGLAKSRWTVSRPPRTSRWKQ